MKRRHYDFRGEKLLRTESATPKCDVDFCDDCGDCLICYAENDCGGVPGRTHTWVVYEEPRLTPDVTGGDFVRGAR